MPIYEFTCDECRQDFEELVFGRDETVLCPKCGASKLTKNASAFAFKSGGKFVSASGGSCQGCHPGASGCGGCHGK